MPLRAVLFDHDGTLVNSEPIHLELWNAVLRKYRIELSEAEYTRHYAGVPTPANAAALVERYGIPADPPALALEKNLATERHLSSTAFPLMPGVRAAVAGLADLGLRLAIVTGANANGVRATVRAYRFEALFSVVVSGDDVRHSKPAPDCYLLALARLGLRADECLAVEDTEHGLRAASLAGVGCLAVPTEMSRHHDFSLAAGIFADMAAARAHIQTEFARRAGAA